MTAIQKKAALKRLRAICVRHDRLEREALILMRKFTDKELKRLGMAAGG